MEIPIGRGTAFIKLAKEWGHLEGEVHAYAEAENADLVDAADGDDGASATSVSDIGTVDAGAGAYTWISTGRLPRRNRTLNRLAVGALDRRLGFKR